MYDVIQVVLVFWVVYGVALCWLLAVNSACTLFVHVGEGFVILFVYSLVFVNAIRHRILWCDSLVLLHSSFSCSLLWYPLLCYALNISSYPWTYDVYIYPCILMYRVITCFWTMHSSVQSLNCFKFGSSNILVLVLLCGDENYSAYPFVPAS